MGVDPKRPLVGFALVAVLCAVLMTLSVGRGWALDLFQPGKPISASAAGGHVERVPVAPPSEPAQVSIPPELSTRPLGVAAGGPVPAQSATRQTPAVEDDAEAAAAETTLVGTTDRKAGKAALKAQRTADKAAEKLQRLADKAAARAARDAAKAERHAAKAERHAARLADQLARSAQKAAEKAVKQAVKASVKASVKAAEKAARQS